MNKQNEIVSLDLIDKFDVICKKLGIDTQVHTPVRISGVRVQDPFVYIYCINKLESTPEKEWIEKFEVLTVRGNDKIFKDIPEGDVAIDEKYLTIEHDQGNTVDWPDEED